MQNPEIAEILKAQCNEAKNVYFIASLLSGVFDQ